MSDQEDAALLQVGDASGNVNSSEDSKELSRMRWSWQLVLSILVLPVLFTFKPSEWFLVSYLEHQFNLTQTVVDTVVFPLWTYSFLGFTLLFTVLSAFQVPGKWCLVVALVGRKVVLFGCRFFPPVSLSFLVFRSAWFRMPFPVSSCIWVGVGTRACKRSVCRNV
jgi:hypothetical protein